MGVPQRRNWENMVDILKYKIKTLGCCPVCGKSGPFMNIGRDCYGFCQKHKTKWLIYSNLYSAWQNENEIIWDENERFLSDFIDIP